MTNYIISFSNFWKSFRLIMDTNNGKANTLGGESSRRMESLKRHHPSCTEDRLQKCKRTDDLQCIEKTFTVASSEAESSSKVYEVHSEEHETPDKVVAKLEDKIQALECVVAEMKKQLNDVFHGKNPAESQQIEPYKLGPISASMLPSSLSSMHQGSSLGQSPSLQNQQYFAPACQDQKLKAPLIQHMMHHNTTNLPPPQWQQLLPLQENGQLQPESQRSGKFLQQYATLHHDLHQRPQALGQVPGFLQQLHNVGFQQNVLPETSSMSLNLTVMAGEAGGFGWQEEAYQRIKPIEMVYSQELNEMYKICAATSHETDHPLQQPNSEWLQNISSFKHVLGHMPSSSQNPRETSFEQMNIIDAHRRYVLAQQRRKILEHGLSSLQQQQPEIPQAHSLGYEMNPHGPTTNLQPFSPILQHTNKSFRSSLSGESPLLQNQMHQLHPGSNSDFGQGTSLSSLHPVAVGLEHLHPTSFLKRVNINPLSSQSRVNVTRSKDPVVKFQSTLASERAASVAAGAITVTSQSAARMTACANTATSQRVVEMTASANTTAETKVTSAPHAVVIKAEPVDIDMPTGTDK